MKMTVLDEYPQVIALLNRGVEYGSITVTITYHQNEVVDVTAIETVKTKLKKKS